MHRLCSLNNAGYLHFIEWWYTLFTYQLSGQAEYEEICERKDMALLIFHISPHPVGKALAGWDVSCSADFCMCMRLLDKNSCKTGEIHAASPSCELLQS